MNNFLSNYSSDGNETIAHRLSANPLLSASMIPPSQPSLEVVSVFNAACARVGDEIILLLRVAEQPPKVTIQTSSLKMFDLSVSGGRLVEFVSEISSSELVGVAFLNTDLVPPSISVGYIPKDLPGLDLSDPRAIRYYTQVGDHFVPRDMLAQISHLRIARSKDGIHFEVDAKPALSPANNFEEYGCEDPRATLIDGVWHITYVSVGRVGITTSLALTTDFRHFERRGVIFLPDNKDVCLFPSRVGNSYVALTRPMPPSFDRIHGLWIAFSPDLLHWGGHQPLALPRSGYWDEVRTGASCVPFRVPQGWLEIYHGVDRDHHYSLGALLLDGEDPRKVLGRSPTPLLDPTEVYERTGFFKNTVFSCGHVDLDEGPENIRVYYGAADQCLCAADFSVREIIESLEPC